MKKHLIIGLILAISIFALFGCSDDDDCPACPGNVQDGIAMVYAIAYDGNLDAYGIFYGIDGRFIDLDSAKIGNYKLYMDQYFGEGMATYCYVEEDEGPSASPGQIVNLSIYTPGGICTSSIELLDNNVDEPQVYNWMMDYPYDTVALNSEVVVAWAPVARADYYAVDWRYNHNNSGTNMEIDTAFWTTDTSFTLPTSLFDYDGRIYFDIYAINGPTFDEPGNIDGDVIQGRFMSISNEYFRIYIGSGDPYPADFIGPIQEVEHKEFKDLKF